MSLAATAGSAWRRGGKPRALVLGLGRSGFSAARWLASEGWEVVALEDDPGVAERARADSLLSGPFSSIEGAPPAERAAELARSADLVVPSPGVPFSHPAVAAAVTAGTEVCGELELAWRLLALAQGVERPEVRRGGSGAVAPEGAGAVRLVAVTGTNGKTTVTQLVTAMLVASGLGAVAAGNVGYPHREAVADVLGSGDALAGRPGGKQAAGSSPPEAPAPVLVVEVSSFQLHYSRSFRPDVSCWLNLAPDHLDWHPDLGHYAQAKERVWANQVPGSTVVVNADDPVVMGAASRVPAGVRVVTFGAGAGDGPEPDWRAGRDGVRGPYGTFVAAEDLPRALPHDLCNTAAACAVAMAAGASAEGCAKAARATPAPPHRVELVGEAGGVVWYDDSKATTPASVLAAVEGFASVVLIAGGRNKGLDLSALGSAVPPVHAVVAIGDAAGEVSDAFAPKGVTVLRRGSMDAAVEAAASLARPGDAVLLSPGCASFDWYSSYVERGEHFASLVKSKFLEVTPP